MAIAPHSTFAPVVPPTVLAAPRPRLAAPLAGYSCPDCGSDHPLNGRRTCQACADIHEQAVGAATDARGALSDERGRAVSREVWALNPEQAEDMTNWVRGQAAAAYEFCALSLMDIRARRLAQLLRGQAVAA